MSDKRKEFAKAKFIIGTPIQDIADEFGVSRRTIERWAESGEWRSLRQEVSNEANVVSFTRPKSPARTLPQPPKNPRIPRHTEECDDFGIVESALSELHAALPEAEDKSKGGMAVAIARLVELKRKIKPPSVIDLVERAIELGIRPDDLLRELRDAWARKA